MTISTKKFSDPVAPPSSPRSAKTTDLAGEMPAAVDPLLTGWRKVVGGLTTPRPVGPTQDPASWTSPVSSKLRELLKNPATLLAKLKQHGAEATELLRELSLARGPRFSLGNHRDSGLPELDAPSPDLERILAAMTPSISDTVNKLNSTPGFKGLSDAERAQLTRWCSTSAPVSESIRREVRIVTESSTFTALPADQQTAALRTFLMTEQGLPAVVSIGLSDPTTSPPYELRPPVALPNHGFETSNVDAKLYEFIAKGHHVNIVVPNSFDDNQATIDQIAKGLAALPEASLALVHSVTAQPKTNPLDAHWAEVYKHPGFRSYMTAGAAGDVTIYPSSSPTSQGSLNGSLIHETGHTLSMRLFGTQNTEGKWVEWNNAAKTDGLHVSTYAQSSPDEDFAETLEFYQITKGTPQAAEARKLFPARFAILDSILKVTP